MAAGVTPDNHCEDAVGCVLSQVPSDGTRVLRGTAVDLTKSSGTDAHGNPCKSIA